MLNNKYKQLEENNLLDGEGGLWRGYSVPLESRGQMGLHGSHPRLITVPLLCGV
jgi:hypothetical protein